MFSWGVGAEPWRNIRAADAAGDADCDVTLFDRVPATLHRHGERTGLESCKQASFVLNCDVTLFERAPAVHHRHG